MNTIWLNKPSRPSGLHESIGLNEPDSPFAKLLLNTGDIRLTHGGGSISPKIVPAKL
jgi:hypothetical protein